MVIDFNKPLGLNGINANLGINYPKQNVRFLGNLPSDSFESTSINKYTSEFYLQKAIRSNPKIQKILAEVNIPVKLHMEEFNNLLKTHAEDTRKIAIGITENLPFSLQNKVDKKAVSDAAYLHDTGKSLIPPEILNKKGKLDERETVIMHKHSELGYELLKDSNIDRKTLKLIRNHHQNAKRNGYPFVDKTFNADLNLQIVSTADKFSALTEKRAYKEAMDETKALTIIYNDVKDGKLHPFVFKALANFVNTRDLTPQPVV